MGDHDVLSIKEETARDAAYAYLEAVGLQPSLDAVEQLSGPFTLALAIISERGYTRPEDDEDGKFFWQMRGWKGLVHDILDNAFRLLHFSWRQDQYYENGAVDIINFAGFYMRLKNKGPKWGEMGEPS